MIQYGLPVLFALMVWWFGTGLLLFLDRLPRRTFPWSLAGATGVLLAALGGLASSAPQATPGGAYLAFACAVAVWGWQEMSYYMGLITGPRQAPCPAGVGGWQRFKLALLASLWHELAIVAMGGLIVLLTWNQPNQVGTWTYLILWGMRWSAKLNIFLGVRNLPLEWLPEPLRFLDSFVTRRAMNPLFPVSVTVATLVLALVVVQATAAGVTAFEITGLTLVAALLALGVLEHWVLILPLPLEALWRCWERRSRGVVVG